jgi:hypothetical protein
MATRGLRAPGEAIRQGGQIAEQERQRLDLGHDPIGELPELIARQGICIAGTALPPDVSGVSIHHREVGFAIFVNRIGIGGRLATPPLPHHLA